MSVSKRAYSTNFKDHTGLIKNFARKGWGRMIAAHVSVEYEDVFQELSVTFTKAAASYDPEKGIAFTSYLGRAMWNEFNRYAKRHIEEQVNLGLMSIDSAGSYDDGGVVDMHEQIDSGVRTPEQHLERKQEMVKNLRGLTPTAKFLAANMIAPSEELEGAFVDHRKKMREEGKPCQTQMSLRFVGTHFNIPESRLRDAIKELKNTYGI